MLQSRLFRGDARLQRCLVNDLDHITRNDKGPHVRAIQVALAVIDDLVIADEELDREFYGPSTAKAVLAYKTRRSIINRSYQSTPDDIVGKMTIASLDKDALALETSSAASQWFPCRQQVHGRRIIHDDKAPSNGTLLAQAEGRTTPQQA